MEELLELEQRLYKQAHFILLGEGKKPLHRYGDPTSKNRLRHIPKNVNYGILPINNLLILDLDVGEDISKQEEFFSTVFGVQLSSTLSVSTPSGGKHYYLLAPETPSPGESSLPKGSLRGPLARTLLKEYGGNIRIDADLRSGQQNGYVVGPSENNEYELKLKEIKTIPSESYKRLSKTVSEHYLRSAQRDVFGKIPKSDLLPLESLPEWLYRSLENGLSNRENQSYHSKRAVVKSLLGCCYDDLSIASVCKQLRINKDSYRDKFLSDGDLLQDISKLKRREAHGGPLCKKRFDKKKPEYKKKTFPYENRNKKIGRRRYRVLYMELIARALAKEVSVNSQVYRDAYAIVEHFLQPLSNFGARKIVLANSEMRDYFRFSKSRVVASKRILRKVGVIEIVRPARPGHSTVYQVPKKWDDKALTKILRKTWSAHVLEINPELHPSVEFLHRESVFVDALSRRVLFTVRRNSDKIIPKQLVPNKMGTVALSYLVNEVRYRVSSEGEISDSTIWKPDLVLLATIDDSFFESSTIRDICDHSSSVVQEETVVANGIEGESYPLFSPLDLEEVV